MNKKIALVAACFIISLFFSISLFAASQPRMQEALTHLQQAKAKLEMATHDKGGHRAKALEFVKKAMKQVRKGIRYDNRN